MERKIEPIQPIKKIRAIRKIRALKLHRKPRYRSKLKANLFEKKNGIENRESESETGITNHAHYTPENVGGSIDFKI